MYATPHTPPNRQVLILLGFELVQSVNWLAGNIVNEKLHGHVRTTAVLSLEPTSGPMNHTLPFFLPSFLHSKTRAPMGKRPGRP